MRALSGLSKVEQDRPCSRSHACWALSSQVLTISGRTIRPEAQASPDAAGEAEAAIDAFLAKASSWGILLHSAATGMLHCMHACPPICAHMRLVLSLLIL